MKIYFAGSIRGGRDDTVLYLEMITLLKEYGEVLTEHIGDKELTERGQVHLSDKEIFEKDINLIEAADIVVAEVSTASLGVGYEIGYALSLNKKVVALYRNTQDKKLSAMIAGNEKVTNREYRDISEVSPIFNNIFN